MLWKATATAEKEMQNMKHVWKRYLIVTAMTVVLGLSAGCGSAAEDTNNNQNNTQDENTPDGNENKNNTDGSQVPAGDNNGTSPDTNTDMNNDGTNGTNNNMNGATSGKVRWMRTETVWMKMEISSKTLVRMSVRESKMWGMASEKAWRI